jgi:hypothetical protein
MPEWQVYSSFTSIIDTSFEGMHFEFESNGVTLGLSIPFLSLAGLRIFEELVEVEYLVCASS